MEIDNKPIEECLATPTKAEQLHDQKWFNKHLNPKQRKFAEIYVDCLLPRVAYKKAYPGCKEDSLRVSSYALLENPLVKEYIEFMQEQLRQHCKIDREFLIDAKIEALEIARDKGDTKTVNAITDSLTAMLGYNETPQDNTAVNVLTNILTSLTREAKDDDYGQ